MCDKFLISYLDTKSGLTGYIPIVFDTGKDKAERVMEAIKNLNEERTNYKIIEDENISLHYFILHSTIEKLS